MNTSDNQVGVLGGNDGKPTLGASKIKIKMQKTTKINIEIRAKTTATTE